MNSNPETTLTWRNDNELNRPGVDLDTFSGMGFQAVRKEGGGRRDPHFVMKKKYVKSGTCVIFWQIPRARPTTAPPLLDPRV